MKISENQVKFLRVFSFMLPIAMVSTGNMISLAISLLLILYLWKSSRFHKLVQFLCSAWIVMGILGLTSGLILEGLIQIIGSLSLIIYSLEVSKKQ